MARSRTFPSTLVPTVLAAAVALPLAIGAVLPAASAQGGPAPRTALTADERALASLTERTAVAQRLAQEQALARDTRAAQRAAAEAAARAAAEAAARAAAEAAARAAAEQAAAAERAAAERREAERASRSRRTPSGNPRAIAQAMLAERGQGDQFGCLDRLWVKESGWDATATQIRWGIGYISDRYGSPCAAWRHSQRNNWY